jgi:hypothetical protein
MMEEARLAAQIYGTGDDEPVLFFEVSDDDLERAAGADVQIITFVYCTHYWTNCNSPE